MINKIKPAIINFPGSNCERDIALVLHEHYHVEPYLIWHAHNKLPDDTTHVILPGGFSFGDYLRAGALAAASPIMSAVIDFARSSMPVIGICNGFQILCEAKLLPGVLMRNHHDRFVCKTSSMTWRSRSQKITKTLKLPIAHRDGRYFADQKTLDALVDNDQIMLTYDARNDDNSAEINGSLLGIAGIIGGSKRNIMGLMPHPERAIFKPLGDDGHHILDDFLYGECHEA